MLHLTFKQKDFRFQLRAKREAKIETDHSIVFRFHTEEMTVVDLYRDDFKEVKELKIVDDEYYDFYNVIKCNLDPHFNYAFIEVTCVNPANPEAIVKLSDENEDEFE